MLNTQLSCGRRFAFNVYRGPSDSKDKFQAELNLPGRLRAGNYPGLRIYASKMAGAKIPRRRSSKDIGTGQIEVRMVEYVEDFRAKLEIQIFADSCTLHQSQIGTDKIRTPHGISAHIT